MKFYVDPQEYGGPQNAERLAKAAEVRFPDVRFAIGPTHCTKVEGHHGLVEQIAGFLEQAESSPALPDITTIVTGDVSFLTEAAEEAAAAPPRPPIRFPVSRRPHEPPDLAVQHEGGDRAQLDEVVEGAELVEQVSGLLHGNAPPNDERA